MKFPTLSKSSLFHLNRAFKSTLNVFSPNEISDTVSNNIRNRFSKLLQSHVENVDKCEEKLSNAVGAINNAMQLFIEKNTNDYETYLSKKRKLITIPIHLHPHCKQNNVLIRILQENGWEVTINPKFVSPRNDQQELDPCIVRIDTEKKEVLLIHSLIKV